MCRGPIVTAPDFLDEPPRGATLTDHDIKHLKLYVRLLDADADGADWAKWLPFCSALIPVMIPSAPGTSTNAISCAPDG